MIWKALLVFVLSTTKMLVAMAMLVQSDWSFLYGFILSVAGGLSGIFFYTFLGQKAKNYWEMKFQPKAKVFKMNKRKRLLVKFKKGYGLAGIAFLSPMLISIPAGCMISLAMTDNRKQIILYQSISVIFWVSLVLGLKSLFNISLTSALK
jgi:hypothetical protein